MESNLARDMERKAQILKKGVKELQDILTQVHEYAKKANNNKLIYIKRDVDKIKEASKYLHSLDLPNPKEVKTSSFDKDMEDLHKATLKSISKMQELYRKQEVAEKKDLHYNGKFFSNQKNLDNLRQAYSRISQMGSGLRLSKQDWNEIENK